MAGPVVIFVDLLSLPLYVAASVLKANLGYVRLQTSQMYMSSKVGTFVLSWRPKL